jgi:hypothetical protein
MSEKRLFILAHDEARRRAGEFVASAPKNWRVTVEPPKRSGDQNAKLHALIDDIAKAVEWAGRKWPAEVWKRLLVSAWCRTHGSAVLIVPALDGQGVDMVPTRTSTLNKAECSELLEFVQAWAAENMPDEVTA